MIAKDLPSDNIYGYALSKTLTKVASPVTVGLYSSCHSRVNMVLKSIKVWTEQNLKQTNVRYIFVQFSAWHFAGSDMLWAGLVMRLCEGLQESFGVLLLPLYRVAQYTEEEVKKVIEDSEKEWRSKKICCFPLWLLIVGVLLVVLLIVFLLLSCGFPKGEHDGGEDGESDEGRVSALEGFAIAILGVPAVGALRFIFLLGKNLILNQNLNIKNNLDNQKVSSQLGFMNEVRNEMRALSCFIQFMEVFERRKIRVVLQITHLDRCTPKKITGVLDAINILLSDEECPFISMLAVNPEILVQQLDYADGCFSKEDRAYAFLNRIVTLPFTVPELCDASKCKVFRNIVQGQSEIKHDFSIEESGPKALGIAKYYISHDKSFMKSAQELVHLSNKDDKAETTHIALELNEEEVERLIERAFECIYRKEGDLHSYIIDDTISMRRIINSIRVLAIIMEAMHIELPSPEDIAAWVILANQWPCRLSWILQCLEDDLQRTEIDGEVAAGDDSKTLWEVFSESRLELYMIRDKVESHLEQDGDPELFEKFLKVDFKFTIKDANRFKLATVNLDHSIKKELSRIRGSTALRDMIGKNTLTPLPIGCVINMSIEDVCIELGRLELPEKYSEAIRENKLNGQALVYNENAEIRHVLQMSMGEWTTFSIHFLGIYPPRLPLLKSESPPSHTLVALDCP
ncbi:hypothetical protein AAFF_G00400560 [Aldrovandia affinis]|uniref:KAP NTPase domain-containing protein n=1 Tax=Aldrovandia affinis TaxID=143900 RepID=A0AAD7WKA4_9TELE|nr:hypothetical protein AAFF_G00400560 [Aldrovandia affinis]